MMAPAALWAERSPRQRWMIGALAVLIGALIYWYGLWLPLGAWRHTAALRLETAQRVSFEADRLRAGIANLDKPGPLESDITASAGEAGVRIGKIETGELEVTIRLEGVKPANFLAWTRWLAEHKAIAVTDMTATAAGGDAIDVEVMFSRAGA